MPPFPSHDPTGVTMTRLPRKFMLHTVVLFAIAALVAPAMAATNLPLNAAPVLVVVYMTVMFTVLGFGGVLAVAAGRWIWALYGTLAAYAVLWQSWESQAAAGVFWQGFEFTDQFVIRTGMIMTTFAMVSAALATPVGHWSRHLRLPIFVLAGASVIIWLAVDKLAPTHSRLCFDLVNLTAMAIQVVPLSTLALVEGRRVRWLIFIGVGLPLVFVALYGAILYGIEMEFDRFVLNRITLGSVIIYGAFALAIRIAAIRNDREAGLRAALEAAEKEAQTSRQLLDAERKYAAVRDVARMQQTRLAEASHDIKQPITSLRATIDTLLKDQPAGTQAQLREAFNYLERLAASYGTDERLPAPVSGNATESIPVAMMAGTLERMFRADAEKKGLDFEVSSIDAQVNGDPLVLMRILSNLVSNAIRHTQEGKVRIDIARGERSVNFEVFSSSAAIGPDEVERIFEPRQKGETSDGQGLGLAIVRKLADNAGWTLDLEPRPGAGNAFILRVPPKG